jgi:hypothetical protein
VAHKVADTIVEVGAPLFWDVLRIGLLASFGEFESCAFDIRRSLNIS